MTWFYPDPQPHHQKLDPVGVYYGNCRPNLTTLVDSTGKIMGVWLFKLWQMTKFRGFYDLVYIYWHDQNPLTKTGSCMGYTAATVGQI
jgi:hypothetical protein